MIPAPIHAPARRHCTKCGAKAPLINNYCNECRFLLRLKPYTKPNREGLRDMGLLPAFEIRSRLEPIPTGLRVQDWYELDPPAQYAPALRAA